MAGNALHEMAHGRRANDRGRGMRLFHFSDDPRIERFVPRPVQVPSERGPGREWLNGPLVWAIDDWHAPMYFFPRHCPRILVWAKADTTEADRQAWFAASPARMLIHIEWAWLERVMTTPIHRYALPPDTFESLDDAGMWVSRREVEPVAMETLADLPAAMRQAQAELRVMESLTPLRDIWRTTLHASGIRLRNAQGWT
jgi:hypothetical protein